MSESKQQNYDFLNSSKLAMLQAEKVLKEVRHSPDVVVDCPQQLAVEIVWHYASA
ncbi:MAG: hypothetical protein AAF528_12765 [Cyanobacteria bacterium P01_C01_bin.121]